MMVERYSKVDALDMTWVRFRATLASIKKALRLERGQQMSAAEHIEEQRFEKEGDF